MKTIPDAIDDMKLIIKKIIDKPLSWIEHIGSKMNVYAWNKRWGNRKKVMATETKICKDCNHQCHCKEDLHADEYGLCPCKACKC